MAEKESSRPNFGLKVQEADEYRDWQHKSFTEIASGDTYQLINFVWGYRSQEVGVILAYTRFPRYKTIISVHEFKELFVPVVT